MNRLIFSALICFCCLESCKSGFEETTPVEQKITESVYASGILKSKDQYQVFSVVNGLVSDIFVTEGDVVHKGDRIMSISNTTASLNEQNASLSADFAAIRANEEKLDQLKNNVELAKAKMDNEALLLSRQKNLWEKQIGTRNELDIRQLAYDNAVNGHKTSKLRYVELQKQLAFQSKQSKKQLQIAQTILNDYDIKSEIEGKVYKILREKGEMVNPQTAVAFLGDAHSFSLELQIDEYDISRIKEGQKIFIRMDSYQGQVFEASVKKIYPLMNERLKSFTVEASFLKTPPSLYPNLTCEANISIQEKQKALTIPRSYLQEGDYVLLSNKERRKVIVGLKDYELVEIISGLTLDDHILKPL